MIAALFLSIVCFAADPPAAGADAAPALPAAEATTAVTADEPAIPAGPDRSRPPTVAEPVLRSLPEPEEHTIGAVKVHFVPVDGIRKVAILVRLQRGSIDLAGQPTEWTGAMNTLWGEETAEHTAAELSILQDLNGVELGTGLGPHDGFVRVVAPKDKLDVAIGVGREVLTVPEFTGKDTKRWIRDREVFLAINGPASQGAVADAALAFSWYPADHPYGARPDLYEAQEMKRKTLEQGYTGWLASAPLEITAVGDLTWAELEPHLTRLVAGLGTDGNRWPDLPFAPPAKNRVIAVHMPGQEQVAVRLRTPAPLRDDPDRMAAWALNWGFGGNFLSRLNSNLREEKGYTYGARSGYQVLPTRASFSVSVDVPKGVLASTIMEIEHEMQALVDQGLTDVELDAAWRSAASSWNDTFADAYSSIGTYDGHTYQGESLTAARARYQQLAELTPQDTRRVAARWFGAETPRVWVLVGDKAAIEEQVAGLGWTLEWVEPASAFVGAF